jgi:hypothetical protein
MSARVLKIKTGTATRTRKELLAYTTELTKERAKLDAMKAAAGDHAQIKQQVRTRRRRRLPPLRGRVTIVSVLRRVRQPHDSGCRIPPSARISHRPRRACRGLTARPLWRRCGQRSDG